MAAATVVGVIGGNGSSVSWMQFGRKGKKQNKMNRVRVCCSSSSSVTDSYKMLRIQPGASESEVRKAFRQLALQYHPDVCKGKDCGVQFHQINEAYDVVMAKLREPKKAKKATLDDESFRGMNDSDWEYWEEWMGWEGAWISHINPYI
ncbi:chaperone protein dnaJ 8, chloroplastic [Vicia villosa]|uniref:chaperone protein dnaJ 8, chloroplastic n=1 Tax=Vicia villosa TaxID=3911 RepID=UPI00273BE43D|nr:chaperone protein dnaJ 8, chloroplastic [Vicia villosa]